MTREMPAYIRRLNRDRDLQLISPAESVSQA